MRKNRVSWVRYAPLLLCGPAHGGEVPIPSNTPELDKAIAEAEDALIVRCAQLSEIVYIENLECRVCRLEGPFATAFICVVREH